MATESNWKSEGFLVLLLASQIVVYFVVYGNIPFLRATVCFLYLLFIPGIVILKLLSLKNLDTVEKALFSVGLSIVFLMFVGLIVDVIGRLVFVAPLSLNILLVSINTATLLIALIVAKRGDANLPHLPELTQWLFPILLCISFFVLGSIGILMVNISGNSSLLLFLIIAISVAVPLVLVSEKYFPSRWYPLILFAIAICVLFFINNYTALITRYVTGRADQPLEFHIFRLTELTGFWNPTATFSYALTPIPFPEYYSMLSLTILPTIFSSITGLDSSLLFKLFYPFVVSFLVLGSYKLYQTQTGNKEALVATFFLIIVSTGVGWGPSRQEIAALFYVLLFLLLFKKNISTLKRNMLFIIFSVGLVLSHYSLSYLFMLTLPVAYFLMVLIDKRSNAKGMFSNNRKKIPLILVLFFVSITFSWYIFVDSSASFVVLVDTANTVVSNLNKFFNMSSRGSALQGLGLIQTPNIFHSLSVAFFLASEFLLFVGFLALIKKRKKTLSFSIEYEVIAAVNMLIIGINILLPNIADTFVMARFYQTTIIILAPLAVLGGKTLVELIPKPNIRKISLFLIFVVLIPLFLFQTGFVYEVAQVPGPSLPLSMYRWSNFELYSFIVNDQQVTGAQWLAKYTNTTNIFVYSDEVSRDNVLWAYGMLEKGRVEILSNTTRLTSNDYAYLSNINLINNGEIFNSTNLTPILQNQNIIFSNGQCEIYKASSP